MFSARRFFRFFVIFAERAWHVRWRRPADGWENRMKKGVKAWNIDDSYRSIWAVEAFGPYSYMSLRSKYFRASID